MALGSNGASDYAILDLALYCSNLMITKPDANAAHRVRRMPERGHYDTATIYAIIDEALICHVGLVEDGQPFVIPTIHARMGDMLVLHGAPASRLLKYVHSGAPLCVTFTLLDGLVLARSTFHSSMNYRSAIVFGAGRLIDDVTEKLRAFETITEHIAKGRWEDSRKPTPKEIASTGVVAIDIAQASAKIRTGPPNDDDEDYALNLWAGVIPIQPQHTLPAIADPQLREGIALPEYLARYRR
jgi:hypothetical protein